MCPVKSVTHVPGCTESDADGRAAFWLAEGDHTVHVLVPEVVVPHDQPERRILPTLVYDVTRSPLRVEVVRGAVVRLAVPDLDPIVAKSVSLRLQRVRGAREAAEPGEAAATLDQWPVQWHQAAGVLHPAPTEHAPNAHIAELRGVPYGDWSVQVSLESTVVWPDVLQVTIDRPKVSRVLPLPGAGEMAAMPLRYRFAVEPDQIGSMQSVPTDGRAAIGMTAEDRFDPAGGLARSLIVGEQFVEVTVRIDGEVEFWFSDQFTLQARANSTPVVEVRSWILQLSPDGFRGQVAVTTNGLRSVHAKVAGDDLLLLRDVCPFADQWCGERVVLEGPALRRAIREGRVVSLR